MTDTFDCDAFALCLASHLLGLKAIRQQLSSSWDNDVLLSLYWRSSIATTPTSHPSQQQQQLLWVDVTWDISSSRNISNSSSNSDIQLRIGGVWKQASARHDDNDDDDNNNNNKSLKHTGYHRSSPILDQAFWMDHFGRQTAIDLESTPVTVLAKTIAEALQHCTTGDDSTTRTHNNSNNNNNHNNNNDNNTIDLYYPELQQSAQLSLQGGEERTFSPSELKWLLQTVHYSKNSSNQRDDDDAPTETVTAATTTTTTTATCSDWQTVRALIQEHQQQAKQQQQRRQSEKAEDSLLNQEESTTTVTPKDDKDDDNTTTDNKSTKRRRPRHHGYARVGLKRRKATKFASQK